jgi:hypothetical protein
MEEKYSGVTDWRRRRIERFSRDEKWSARNGRREGNVRSAGHGLDAGHRANASHEVFLKACDGEISRSAIEVDSAADVDLDG